MRRRQVPSKSGVSAEGDYVLDAIGRVANMEDLGLEELGIQASRILNPSRRAGSSTRRQWG